MSQPAPVPPANDNTPPSSSREGWRGSLGTSDAATGVLAGRNILGFFNLLDTWNRAANDNEPAPAIIDPVQEEPAREC